MLEAYTVGVATEDQFEADGWVQLSEAMRMTTWREKEAACEDLVRVVATGGVSRKYGEKLLKEMSKPGDTYATSVSVFISMPGAAKTVAYF